MAGPANGSGGSQCWDWSCFLPPLSSQELAAPRINPEEQSSKPSVSTTTPAGKVSTTASSQSTFPQSPRTLVTIQTDRLAAKEARLADESLARRNRHIMPTKFPFKP